MGGASTRSSSQTLQPAAVLTVADGVPQTLSVLRPLWRSVSVAVGGTLTDGTPAVAFTLEAPLDVGSLCLRKPKNPSDGRHFRTFGPG